MQIRFVHNFPENPSNPARCHVPTGNIEINKSRWDFLSDEEQEFVLQHEMGHYVNQTFDETEADNYALKQLALKKPYSLINFIKSVRNISHNDHKRVKNAERNALIIAANDGSTEAKRLLSMPFYANADGKSYAKWGLTLLLIILIIAIIIIIVKK